MDHAVVSNCKSILTEVLKMTRWVDSLRTVSFVSSASQSVQPDLLRLIGDSMGSRV